MNRLAGFARLAALVAVVGLTSIPAGAARREMEILQSDVDELQRQVYDLKQSLQKQGEDLQKILQLLDGPGGSRQELAAFNANVEALQREIRALGARFDQVAERLRTLEFRVAEASRGGAAAPRAPALAGEPEASGGGEPPAATAASVPAAEVLYQQAYGDYLKDNFNLAISEFREFILSNPHSELADNAQYWVGMSYFNSRQFAEAVQAFDGLLSRYPQAENAPDAMYRKGVALLELRRIGQAVLVFNDLVSQYPESPAAKQAQERLRELASGEN